MPQIVIGKYARATFAKGKRKKAVCPKHQIVRWERVKMRDLPWQKRGASEKEHGKERVDFTVKKGRLQKDEGGQARRASLEVEGSMSG